MKKQTLFPIIQLFLLIILSSCVNINGTSSAGSIGSGSGGSGDNGNGSGSENERISVLIQNNSVYDVNIYQTQSPYWKDTPDYTVKALSDFECKMLPSDEVGYPVYFEYLIDVGNVKIPYWDKKSNGGFKSLIVQSGMENSLIIDEIVSCPIKSSYFVFENQTTSEINVINGNTLLKPASSESIYIEKNGETGVFEVSDSEKAPVNFGLYSSVKVVQGNDYYPLPPEITSSFVEKGNIYTFVLATDSSSGTPVTSLTLKSVTPFNIDTRKKIWSLDDENFIYDNDDSVGSVIRSSYDANGKIDGTYIMGTLKNEPSSVAFYKINEYGVFETGSGKVFSPNVQGSEGEEVSVTQAVVHDFLVQSDGSVVMLIRSDIERKKDGAVQNEMIYSLNCYDFEKGYSLWNCNLNFDGYNVRFMPNSRNVIISLGDNKICFGGTLRHGSSGSYKFAPMLGIVDFSKPNGDGTFSENIENYPENENGEKIRPLIAVKNSETGDFYDNESIFTSLYFDGSDIFAAGYVNFDGKYSENGQVHSGIVYKFSSQPESLEIWGECVYKSERTLFFSIAGNKAKSSGSTYWYAAGEYWNENNDGTRGCFINSYRASQNEKPFLYSAGKKYNWYNQACLNDGKIIFCGTTSNTSDASIDFQPFTVCFDFYGVRMWENLSFSGYCDALNIIPNSIGTYLLQLVSSDGKYIHFINADMLGREVL